MKLKQVKSVILQLVAMIMMGQLIACSEKNPVVPGANNTPPVAIAGQDQHVKIGDVIQLDAQGSYANKGELQYQWQVINKPIDSKIVIVEVNAIKTHFIADMQGDYQVKLTVTDEKQHSASAQITIVVSDASENSVPVARITPDRLVATTEQVIKLSAHESSDADDDPLAYAWSIIEKPSGSNIQLSLELGIETHFSADLEGRYLVGLKVSDETSNNITTLELTINNGNHTPIAEAGDDQNVLLDTEVILDGSNSVDEEGDTLGFEWSFGSKPNNSQTQLIDSTVEKPRFTPDVEGEYVVKLRVFDENSISEFDQLLITVTSNQAPIASAGENRQVVTGSKVTLDGSASSDPEQDALQYVWEFIQKPDGHSSELNMANTSKPEFVADVEGQYIIKLVVNDAHHDSVPDTITINSKMNLLPIAKIDGNAEQYASQGDRVTFSGGKSSDPEAEDLTYRWALIAPDNSTATLEGNTQEDASFTADIAGSYRVNLVVNDGTQDSSAATTILTVYPDEAMFDVSVTGKLLDSGNKPLQNILIYSEQVLENTQTDEEGNFNFNIKAPASSLDSFELIFSNTDLIPKTIVTITDLAEDNTSVNIGQRNIPVLQDKDLHIWECNAYDSEIVDISFEMAEPQYDDMTFDYNKIIAFAPRTLPYKQPLPATSTIKISSPSSKVTVGVDDTSFVHQYQFDDTDVDVLIIDVCNKD